MKNILFALVAVLLLISAASATYTAISAISSLDGLNDYAAAPTSWTTLAGNESINYIEWPAGYDLIIGVNCTANLTTNYLSIMSGDNPPAFRESIGNLTLTGWSSASSAVKWIGPLESARFMNATGYLQVSSYNIGGTIMALKVAESG
jgi:hypothetical protein